MAKGRQLPRRQNSLRGCLRGTQRGPFRDQVCLRALAPSLDLTPQILQEPGFGGLPRPRTPPPLPHLPAPPTLAGAISE